jgi:hypothetical protein
VIRLLLVPLVATAVTLPVVSGPLPGQRVPLSPAARKAGAIELHQAAVVGSGARRVPLLVGRGLHGQLCVGTTGFFRCLEPVDAQPAYLIVVLGGHGKQREWGAVVGLVGPELARVELPGMQSRLQRVPGFPWRLLTVGPSGPYPRIPLLANLVARGSPIKVFVSLGIGGGCLASRRCSGGGRSWRVAGDSPMAPVGGGGPLVRQAKALALTDPRVRTLLGGATRVVEAVPWTSCGGKLLGGGIHIMLFRPITVTGDLPFVVFSTEKRGHAYAEGIARYDVDGVDQVNVQVDLTRHRVVAIDPTGTDLRSREYRVVENATPAGPLDPAVCHQGD